MRARYVHTCCIARIICVHACYVRARFVVARLCHALTAHVCYTHARYVNAMPVHICMQLLFEALVAAQLLWVIVVFFLIEGFSWVVVF